GCRRAPSRCDRVSDPGERARPRGGSGCPPPAPCTSAPPAPGDTTSGRTSPRTTRRRRCRAPRAAGGATPSATSSGERASPGADHLARTPGGHSPARQPQRDWRQHGVEDACDGGDGGEVGPHELALADDGAGDGEQHLAGSGGDEGGCERYPPGRAQDVTIDPVVDVRRLTFV